MMFWKKKNHEKLIAPEVDFLGPQEGPAESALKEKVTATFERMPEVDRAYLCQVGYGDDLPGAVAMCLCISRSSEQKIVNEVSKIFAAMFSNQQHLDIIFLDKAKEAKIDRVCPPFYVRES